MHKDQITNFRRVSSFNITPVKGTHEFEGMTTRKKKKKKGEGGGGKEKVLRPSVENVGYDHSVQLVAYTQSHTVATTGSLYPTLHCSHHG